jgi:hypothetical protein
MSKVSLTDNEHERAPGSALEDVGNVVTRIEIAYKGTFVTMGRSSYPQVPVNGGVIGPFSSDLDKARGSRMTGKGRTDSQVD